MSDGKFWLGQLRHAYKNALDGRIGSQESYAKHLLGPAVAGAEKYVTEVETLLAEKPTDEHYTRSEQAFRDEARDHDNTKKRNAAALKLAKEWLAQKDAHEVWCEAKGRCTYCDPLNDIIEALEGTNASGG